jgi:LysM repeat protein
MLIQKLMKNCKLFFLFFFIGILSILAQDKPYTTYKVAEGETVQSISKKLSITPFDLLKLNPDIEKNVKVNDILIIPNKEYNAAIDISTADLSVITAKDIIVDGIIYHEAAPKETLFSILQKYNVTKEQMNSLNPFLLRDGLKQGQVVKIPMDIDAQKLLDIAKNNQPYLVKSKETKYSIAREYGITVRQLEELNPKIKENGLQVDDVIYVPKKGSEASGAFQIHKVEKLETFYSLSNKFDMTKEELIAVNPELKEGVKEGMLIKIPNKTKENTNLFIDEILPSTKLNVALMLPFKAKIDTLDFEKDRLLQVTTDFYFGALQAIDSLKNQGLSLDIKVYDTENSEWISKKITESSDFDTYDVVIGPMYYKNVVSVAQNLQYKKPFIISPLSSKDHSVISNRNLVQDVPTDEHLALEMLQYIKATYANQKITIFLDDQLENKANVDSWVKEIESLDSLRKVTVIQPVKGYIKPDIFKKNIVKDQDNWVVLIGNRDVFIADIMNNLGVLGSDNKVTLFAFNKNKAYDKIDNNYLSRVNFHYPSTTFFDTESEGFHDFVSAYTRNYSVYPSEFAMDGFDVTYDILMRLASHTDLIGQGVSQRLSTKYNYIENTSKGVLNKGIFIVKYEDLTLKKIK